MIYCPNPYADEPIMLLNREIGADEGMIDGARFQQELLELDSMGKKTIKVWINSPGGNLLQGYNIVNAILKSKTPVDTYNVGIAASIAGAVFMAGRKRYMSDYARLMMHPVQGSTDRAQYDSLMDSIATVLSSKSKCSEDKARNMMQATTWLNASECFVKGFCTDVEYMKDENKKYLPTTEATALWAEVNNSLKLEFSNIKHMKKVTNLLNLNSDASEDSIVEAVNALKQANNSLTNEAEELQAKVEKAEADLAEANAELKKAQDHLAAQEAATQQAEEAAALAEAANKAEALIAQYANRIGNDAEVRSMWVSDATNNLEATEKKLKALPLNAKAPVATAENNGQMPTLSAAGIMAEVQNKLKSKN